MPLLYYLNVSLHLFAALVWLGGMLFLAIVGAPALRRVEPPSLRQQLFQVLGVRFAWFGWVCLVILVATGIVNLHYRGWLQWNGVLGSGFFWASPTGRDLAIKLGAVAVMIVVSAVHDFILGPRAGHAVPGSPEALQLRRNAALLARVNALLGVVVVLAAVRLARGG